MITPEIIPEPRKTLEKRREIEKKLCKRFSVSVEDLAEYFNTTPKIIRGDISELQIKTSEKSSPKIYALRKARDKEIEKRIENGEEKSAVLTEYGLWRMPKNLEAPTTNLLSELSQSMVCSEEKKNRTLALIELGWSSADTYKRVGGLDSVNRTFVEEFVRSNNLSPKYVKENDRELNELAGETLKQAYEKSQREGEPYRHFRNTVFKDVLSLTGASEIKMYEAIGKHSYADNKKQISSSGKVKIETKKEDKEKLKLEVYRAWTAGEATQQELADKYNLTRATIMNYIYDVKAKNISELQNEIPTVRRRNSQEKIRTAVAKKKADFLSKYALLENKETLSLYKISNLTGYGVSDVKKFLLEENLIPSSYENSNLRILEEATTFSQDSYSLGIKSLFGYGPNADSVKESNYAIRHSRQKETMVSLNNSNEFRESFNENNGDILPYFLPKNEKAKKEYESKYKSNLQNIEYDDFCEIEM